MGPGLGEADLDKKTFIHSSTCYITHECFFKGCEYRKSFRVSLHVHQFMLDRSKSRPGKSSISCLGSTCGSCSFYRPSPT